MAFFLYCDSLLFSKERRILQGFLSFLSRGGVVGFLGNYLPRVIYQLFPLLLKSDHLIISIPAERDSSRSIPGVPRTYDT